MAARKSKRTDGRYGVSVCYEDSAGVRRRHYVYGRTQAEANAKAKAVRQRLLAMGATRVSRPTPPDWRSSGESGAPPLSILRRCPDSPRTMERTRGLTQG